MRLKKDTIKNVVKTNFPSLETYNENIRQTIEDVAICMYNQGYQDGVNQAKIDRCLSIPVSKRTNEQHRILIELQFYGSVRDYLLSMDAFKNDISTHDASQDG